MEVIEHFSHEHPLTLCEDQAKDHRDDEEVVVCSGCNLSVLGTHDAAYSCTKCNFFLHKSCAESPNKITCVLHRHHPLTLYENKPYDVVTTLCDICDEQVLGGFTYCCERCEVNFHLKCALEHRFEPKGHQHSFMLERPVGIPFTCDSCGITSTRCVSFLCTTCQLRVHKNCTCSYPLAVKHVGHSHQLRLTYSTEFEEFKGRLCRICYQRFDHQLCCYTCASCFNYIAHLDCATAEDIRDEALFVTMEDEENQARTLMSSVDSNQVTDLGLITTQDVFIELSLKAESSPIVPVLITHFSHKHCLRLNNINEELKKSEEVCDGCTQPISSSIPFYSCVDDCHFFLHKSCAELPNKIQHTLHRHPLTLVTKVPWHDFVMFQCDICERLSNGFAYACEICNFSIDVLCSSFLDTLEHKCHPAHVLNLVPICYDDQVNCNACDSSPDARFVCEECKFDLDLRCASLPYQIKHDCPKHNWHTRPLNLIYKFVEGDECGESEEYYCDVCEERREKNEWFYYCADCDYSAHPWCTTAKCMIKFGKSYLLPHHPSRPLTLVENNTIGNPPCATCGDPCKNLVLVCSECNFNIHSVEECYVLHD